MLQRETQSQDYWMLPCGQDPLAGWDEHNERMKKQLAAEAAVKKKEIKIKKRKNKESLSYVISKMPQRGRRVIKIQIYEYDERLDSNCESVRVQYSSADVCDEIMDLAETIVGKISKKICTNLNS